jgi:PD-(D/E)XK nuclease superfamily
VLLTDPQRRTLDRLIGHGERPVFDPELPGRLADRIRDELAGIALEPPIWLGKEKLKDHDRCPGSFEAKLSGAGTVTPFEHGERSATGVLLHAAIEIEVGVRDELDAHTLAAKAAERLVAREERFAEFWDRNEALDRDLLLMESARAIELFRASFPPLRELRAELTPMTEFRARTELVDGGLVLSGKVDLILGRQARDDPASRRLVIDLKSAGAHPEYVEDLRFYALLLTLRLGVAPYRVASFFLDSGEWQAEDVTEETLGRAVDRVVGAARAAATIGDGPAPQLTPGPWCGWCPVAETCPAADPPDRAPVASSR